MSITSKPISWLKANLLPNLSDQSERGMTVCFGLAIASMILTLTGHLTVASIILVIATFTGLTLGSNGYPKGKGTPTTSGPKPNTTTNGGTNA